MEKSVRSAMSEAELGLPCDVRPVQGVEVPLEKAGGGSVGETPDRQDGDHPAHQKERDAAEAPKAAAEIKKEEKSMRKNAMCDMDCLNCTRPENRCYGGGKCGSMKVAKYHKMTDGKRGGDMPDIAMGRGGKKAWH